MCVNNNWMRSAGDSRKWYRKINGFRRACFFLRELTSTRSLRKFRVYGNKFEDRTIFVSAIEENEGEECRDTTYQVFQLFGLPPALLDAPRTRPDWNSQGTDRIPDTPAKSGRTLPGKTHTVSWYLKRKPNSSINL